PPGRLMPTVDGLLEDCGWEPASLDGLAVSIGPGSFTGLRVGAAPAKGLALAIQVPVAPVPPLHPPAAPLPTRGKTRFAAASTAGRRAAWSASGTTSRCRPPPRRRGSPSR